MPRFLFAMSLIGLTACNVVVWADSESAPTEDTEGASSGFAATSEAAPTGGEATGEPPTTGEPATGGDETGGEAPGGVCDFAGTIQPIFTQHCSGCHGGGQPASGLTLAEGAAHAALVGVDSAEQPGTPRVQPGDPDASWLVAKIAADPPVGARMPIGGALDAAQIEAIRGWIAAGASESGAFACAGGGGEAGEVEIDVDGPLQVLVGETIDVQAIVTSPEGEPLPAAAVTWSSSAERSLYVDGAGTLLGVSVGTAELRAHSGEATSAPVMVEVVAHVPAAATFTEVLAITDAKCAVSGCHVDGVEPGDLRFDRDRDKLWEELVEDEAEEVDGLARVEPGAPAASWLVRKLVERQPEAGVQMPIGGAPMPAAEVRTVVRWILAGAHDD